MPETPFNPLNTQVSKLPIGSRTGSTTGDLLSEGSDRAEEELGDFLPEERGEKYRQQARRQRQIAQGIRQITDREDKKNGVREPRNARFQKRDETTKPILSYVDIGMMLGVAFIFDVVNGILSLIPIIGNAIIAVTVFPLATLYLYFAYKKRGIEFKNTKTLVKFWGSLCIGFIPVLSIFPEYMLNVILISLEKKAEEKLGL